MAIETYSLSAFPNARVNLAELTNEIVSDPTIVTVLDFINVDEGLSGCYLNFASVLSGAEKTALDAVVAAHQGTITRGGLQRKYRQGEDSTTFTTFQTALSTNAKALKGGVYAVVWSCEMKMGSGTDRSLAVFEIDGASFARHFEGDTGWTFHGGTRFTSFSEGETPNLKIKFKVQGSGGDTAYIRRKSIALYLVKVQEEL